MSKRSIMDVYVFYVKIVLAMIPLFIGFRSLLKYVFSEERPSQK
jgi:hypothetical protein